jgi:hypothetical protein
MRAVGAMLIGALLFGCDGGSGDDDTTAPKVTRLLFDSSDVCSAKVPSPTDLFRDDEGKSELSGCPGPSDPIEKELFFAQLDEGVPLNAEIVLPIDGSLSGASLSSTATFSLESGGSQKAIPPLVMLKGSGSATSAADFEVVPVSASFDQAIRVQPSIALEEGYQYVVVATNAIKDDERPQKPIVAAEVTMMLLGSTPIADARLERTRLRLAPILALLAKGSPPIPTASIASIQIFSTVPDPFERNAKIFGAYREAVRAGRYSFAVTTTGDDLPPTELYPGLPASVYASISAYRRGTIRVPAFLGDDLRRRDGFPEVVREIEVPFLITIPTSPPPHGVALYVPGYGRSKLDVRALANEMASTPAVAVLALDLRCHGDRSPDATGLCAEGRTASEVAALTDEEPNNGNMELVGPDGIPDASSQYFFPGDARALRDTQIAAALEILHVYNTLRDADAFLPEGISPDINDLHIVAHGHSAFAALLATAFTDVAPKTVQVPAGGVGYRDLIVDGPPELEASFVATLPSGIGADRADEYLLRLEAGFLRSVSIEAIGPAVKEKLGSVGEARRLLLNHGSGASAVSETARERLIDGVPIPSNRVSEHSQSCDNFFIFSCRLGIDDPVAPREQMITFVSSNGVTVLPP